MWNTITNTKRKKVIAFLVISGLLLIPIAVVYATAYTQDITETLSNITFQPANLYHAIGETLSNVAFQPSGHTTLKDEVMDSLCANFTSGANNCAFSVYFALNGSGVVAAVALSGCGVTPASVAGNGVSVSGSTSPRICNLTATLPSGYKFSGTGNGVVSVSSDGLSETIQTCLGCTIGDSYSVVGVSLQTVTAFTTIDQIVQTTINYTPPSSIGNALVNWTVFLFVNYVPLAFFTIGVFITLRMAKIDDDRVYLLALDLVLTGLYAMNLLNVIVPFFSWVLTMAWLFGGGSTVAGGQAPEEESV